MVLLNITYWVLMFLCRLRFPKDKSIADIIRERYGDPVVVDIRKFEKLDFKNRKAKLDLEFLKIWSQRKIIPNFLRFRFAAKKSRPKDYLKYQTTMLHDTIKSKEGDIKIIERKLQTSKVSLRSVLTTIDFAHITSVFLVGNDHRLKEVSKTHDKKLYELGLNLSLGNDPNKVIHNFSSIVLSASDKSLLIKGLNYAILPTKLNYADYTLNFELLYREVKGINSQDKAKQDLCKCKLKEIALSSFYDFNDAQHPNKNLTAVEFNSLKKLASNKNLIIQKSDKGNSVVLLDKNSYIERILELLSDNSKILSLKDKIKPNKELQFIDEHEKKIRKFLATLLKEEKISKQQHDFLYPRGSQPGVLYGLAKVHKPLVNGFPKFRPILSSIGTCSYNLAKFLVPILKVITVNVFTIQDSFEFGKEVLGQDASLYMGSLDVEALFTSIPLEETINIAVELLFKDKDKVSNFSKKDLKTFLTFSTYEPWFIFDGAFYQQFDGVAMGSPLGPTLANIFMSFHEKEWLEKCPLDFKPIFYRRYVDDIFVMFKSPEHLKFFETYMNTCHQSIRFTSEVEKDGKMPFLDFEFFRENGQFRSTVYRKPTFTGVYSHFESLIPEIYKKGLIYTLLHRIYQICSNFGIITKEVEKLKDIMSKNGYPSKLVDKCIYTFFLKRYATKKIVHTVEKKLVWISLPFLGRYSLDTKQKLKKLFRQTLPMCNLRVIFKASKRVSHFFAFKDKIPFKLRSHNVYHFSCTGCDSCYIGLAERHTYVRWCDHLGLSWRSGQRIVGVQTEIKMHLSTCKSSCDLDSFKILTGDSDVKKLKIKESLLIKKDGPILNKNVYSTPLHLF